MISSPPVRRGDVFAARLDPVEGSEQRGTRPVLVVSNDLFNEVMPVITVLPLTSRREARRVYPSEVLVASGVAGLKSESLVLAHQVCTIARSRLGRRVGSLDDLVMATVDVALRTHLDLA